MLAATSQRGRCFRVRLSKLEPGRADTPAGGLDWGPPAGYQKGHTGGNGNCALLGAITAWGRRREAPRGGGGEKWPRGCLCSLRSPIWSRFAAENHLAGGRFVRHPRGHFSPPLSCGYGYGEVATWRYGASQWLADPWA